MKDALLEIVRNIVYKRHVTKHGYKSKLTNVNNLSDGKTIHSACKACNENHRVLIPTGYLRQVNWDCQKCKEKLVDYVLRIFDN